MELAEQQPGGGSQDNGPARAVTEIVTKLSCRDPDDIQLELYAPSSPS